MTTASTRPLVVGLTGGIGTGKTTVASLFEARGAIVVDCDGLGRSVVEPHGRAYDDVVARFGDGVVAPDGRIDRPALAAIVFADAAALADLNAITHPAIDSEIAAAIDRAASDSIVVLDMAVLVETDLGKGLYDVVVVVEAPLDIRLRRLASRGLNEADARARIASQATDEERRKVGDHVIVNDGDLAALELAVDDVWRVLAAPRQ
jgi:dephospho-CoA kinase